MNTIINNLQIAIVGFFRLISIIIASIFVLIIFNLYMIYLYIRTGLDDETLIKFANKDFEFTFGGAKKKENDNKDNEEEDKTK